MDTKELILNISKEEFISKGFEKTSLRDIAKKCHISPTAIYRHFLNKEEIFKEIIKPLYEYFEELTMVIEAQDYKFLMENKPSDMWAYEQSENFIFKFLFGKYKDLVKLIVKERKESFKKYLIDFEFNVSNKCFNEMRKYNYKINEFNQTTFKIILDSYLEAYLNILYLDDKELKEVSEEINNFYTIGFRNLFGF